MKDDNRDYLFALAGVLGQRFGVHIDDSEIKGDSPEIYSNF